MKHIAGWFRRNNTIMAQAKDLSRQLQEAWAEQERLDKAFDWAAIKVAECRKEKDYLQEQLHRVARERDNERKLRLAAMKDKDYLIDRFHKESALKQAASKTAAKLAVELVDAYKEIKYYKDSSYSWRTAYEAEHTNRQQAEDALLDYHLDKREKDEEGRAAEQGWLADVDNEEE